MAAVHDHLPGFDGNADNWEVYTKRLTHYFTTNGIEDKTKQHLSLLSAYGMFTYKLMEMLSVPDNVPTKSFAQLAKHTKEHFQPKPSIIMRRFCFNSCVRQQDESIIIFVPRLRNLTAHCEY